MQLHITDILQSFDKYEVLTKTGYLAIGSLKDELVVVLMTIHTVAIGFLC